MMQRFVEHDPEEHYFTLLEEHADEFRRMAAFDIVINNTDRKGGHCLPALDDGHDLRHRPRRRRSTRSGSCAPSSGTSRASRCPRTCRRRRGLRSARRRARRRALRTAPPGRARRDAAPADDLLARSVASRADDGCHSVPWPIDLDLGVSRVGAVLPEPDDSSPLLRSARTDGARRVQPTRGSARGTARAAACPTTSWAAFRVARARRLRRDADASRTRSAPRRRTCVLISSPLRLGDDDERFSAAPAGVPNAMTLPARTPSTSATARSTSCGYTLRPPRMMTSLMRPHTTSSPSTR